MRVLASVAVGLAVLAGATQASAQDLGAGAGTTSPPSRSDITAQRPYWGASDPRPFAGVVFETAGISLKTELDLGYGRPHYLWAGASVDTSLSLRGLGAFGGIRAVAPWGSVRFGPRWWTSTNQKQLEPHGSFTRELLDVDEGPRSRYLSLDGEATFAIRLPVGSIGGLLSAYGLFGVEPGYYIFEDSLRVIVAPPFVGRARLTYLAAIGNPGTFRLGGLAELIFNPTRNYFNVRLGPAVAVSLTHHLEALASIAVSVYNRDAIGISGADLGQIGLRYRWATGDLWPEFP